MVIATNLGFPRIGKNRELKWAVESGKYSNPEWYPGFYEVTNVKLSSADKYDMALYWNCKGLNPNNKCTGLQAPCYRSCVKSSE